MYLRDNTFIPFAKRVATFACALARTHERTYWWVTDVWGRRSQRERDGQAWRLLFQSCFLSSLSSSLTCGGGLSPMLCPWRMDRSHFRLLGRLGWAGGSGASNMTFIKQRGVVHRKAHCGFSGPWLLTGIIEKLTSTQYQYSIEGTIEQYLHKIKNRLCFVLVRRESTANKHLWCVSVSLSMSKHLEEASQMSTALL